MFRISLTSILATTFALLSGSPAMAAPQVLAVLSTGTGAAMECEGEICSAMLSTYCLQRDRQPPDTGTIYHAADTSDYSLVLDFPDGSEEIESVDGRVTFSSRRGYKVVSASISKSVLDNRGASGARLVVMAEASLIPEVEANDPDPLTESEIALATGPLRKLGAQVLDSRNEAGTARTLATILRGIPEWRGWPELDYDELWQRVAQVAIVEKTDPDGLARIQNEFDGCVAVHQARETFGVGFCLMQRHDKVLLDLNKMYWETQAGS